MLRRGKVIDTNSDNVFQEEKAIGQYFSDSVVCLLAGFVERSSPLFMQEGNRDIGAQFTRSIRTGK